MNQSSSPNQDHYIETDESDISAKLTIYVTHDGELMYNCDWEPEEEGLVGVASIFFKLLSDNLPEQILEEIKIQCVSTNKEEDFIAIGNLLKIYNSMQDTDRESDEVVVPPDKVMHI
jgi:hypothetical protein